MRPPDSRRGRRHTAAASIAIVVISAGISGCVSFASPTLTDAASPPSEPASATAPPVSVATQSPGAPSAVPFAVPMFEGPRPAPPAGGTTHVYRNPGNAPRADFRQLEYTIPAGWEVGEVYIGKNLGEADEVALSFWTAEGLYPDPCRRSGSQLVPFDLAAHTHEGVEGATVVLLSYPRTDCRHNVAGPPPSLAP